MPLCPRLYAGGLSAAVQAFPVLLNFELDLSFLCETNFGNAPSSLSLCMYDENSI